MLKVWRNRAMQLFSIRKEGTNIQYLLIFHYANSQGEAVTDQMVTKWNEATSTHSIERFYIFFTFLEDRFNFTVVKNIFL